MGDVIGLAKELLALNTAQDTGLRKITVTANDPSRPSHENPSRHIASSHDSSLTAARTETGLDAMRLTVRVFGRRT